MKKKLMKVFASTGLLSALLLISVATSTRAQSLEYRVRANIPFDFSVAEKTLTAGKYSFGRAIQTSDDTILSISDLSGSSRSLSTSMPVESWHTTPKARLVFHRYGDQYFLFQVWPASATTGRQFTKSRAERQVLDNVAKNRSKGQDNSGQIVTIFASVE